MNVLITNDDGIDFEGLRALAEVFSKSFDVYVVAPEGERSSHSHHLNIRGKLRYEEREMPFAKKAYALWGTPADCAHMAIHALLKEKIDLVVSGINRGANVSTDIIYSGTIAAAREAFIYRIPAMALSLDRGKVNDYHMAAEYGRLCFESGWSSIHNWQSGAPEQIRLYELMRETEGVYGGRFCGAGFKGSCMALVDPAFADRIEEQISRAYLADFPQLESRYGVYRCHSADGVAP